MNNFQGFNSAPFQASTSAGTHWAVSGWGATPKTSADAVGTTSAILSGSQQQQTGFQEFSKNQRKRMRKTSRGFWRYESVETSGQTNGGRLEDLRTPSPSVPAKKPRTDFAPKSYSQDASGIRMAVIRTPSNCKMRAEDVRFVNQSIDEAIDDIPPGGEGPQIHASILICGALIINCANESTVAWLRHFFADQRWDDWGYKFISESQIPKPVKIAFKTRDVLTYDSNRLLRRLQLLNPGLNTGEWRALTKGDIKDSFARWIFEIDRESAQFIRAKNLELFAGSHGKGLVKILHDPQAKFMTPEEKISEESPATTKAIATAGATSPMEALAVESKVKTPDVTTKHLSMEQSEAVVTDVSTKMLSAAVDDSLSVLE